jgi:hypothetical protein
LLSFDIEVAGIPFMIADDSSYPDYPVVELSSGIVNVINYATDPFRSPAALKVLYGINNQKYVEFDTQQSGGYSTGYITAIRPAQVPEPSVLALTTIGILLLTIIKRSARKRIHDNAAWQC